MPEMIAKHVLSWATNLEENTINQAITTASMPFVEKPLALMPDAHLGYGATVGSVIATKGAIMPSAVGVDIGCGMIAVKCDVAEDDIPDDYTQWHEKIARAIRAGMGKRGSNDDTPETHAFKKFINSSINFEALGKEVDSGRYSKQFGTLGSGNHFVEICKDENEDHWLVIHSGSRGVGKQLADHHIAAAKGLMKDYFIELADPDLAYLVEHTPPFEQYINDMLWAQDYALFSRESMAEQALKAIPELKPGQKINCHHNYCTQEHHRGQNMWVTRKGAIRQQEGDLGIIPGSMATGTYIVKGLGSPSSFNSASHGAGRKMSRTQARKQFTNESLNEHMQGIAWNEQPKQLLDEHPESYKDIKTVMENQKDLTEIVHTLRPVLNYKGA